MGRWVLLTVFLAGTAQAADLVKYPTPEFQSLSPAQRHLAVYDAFWDALDAHYYDPKLLSAPEWRKLRLEQREVAAAETIHANLYGKVFSLISSKLPESHVGAELPPVSGKSDEGVAGKYSLERLNRLVRLMAYGPGYSATDVRRGNRTYSLVTEVMPNTPAAAAGIRPGWRILKGISSLVMADNAVHFIGEFIPLEGEAAHAWERGDLQPRAGDQWRVVKINFDHEVIRMRLPMEVRRVAGDVRYVRFDAFGDDAFMTPVYGAIEQAGSAGLILDLRWNGGGYATQLQTLAGMLLDEGTLLGTMQNSRGTEPMKVARSEKRYAGPLVIIIGPGSGSSSEILAAAVRDHGRGKLVGRMTNGSTLVSQGFPLPDGGLVRVPISDFRTSKGARIEGVGLVPDVRVMPTLDDVRAGRDPALETALEMLGAAR